MIKREISWRCENEDCKATGSATVEKASWQQQLDAFSIATEKEIVCLMCGNTPVRLTFLTERYSED
jgi:hypothetical protein